MDIKTFLTPIHPDQPSGPSIKYDLEVDKLKKAMHEEPDLPQGVWVHDVKNANWKEAAQIAQKLITSKSKDLQVCAWLVEIWMHLYDIEGVSQGLTLIQEVCEGFWPTLHPQITDDGDEDFRISPFIWMNDKLSQRLLNIKVTQPTSPGAKAYSFWQWEQLKQLKPLTPQGNQNTSAPLEQVGGNDTPSLLDFDTNLSKTPRTFLERLYQKANECHDVCVAIEEFLERHCKADPPSLYRLKKVFENFALFAKQSLFDRGINVEKNEKNPEAQQNFAAPNVEGVFSPPPKITPLEHVKGVPMTPQENPPQDQSAAISSILKSRDEAYQRIQEAANYLAQIEPHSPVPYLIRRAVSWRNKSFMDLMKEMVNDPNGMGDLNRLLGLGDSPLHDPEDK